MLCHRTDSHRDLGPGAYSRTITKLPFGSNSGLYTCCVSLAFKRQINEEQMDDLPDLLEFLLRSAEELEKV